MPIIKSKESVVKDQLRVSIERPILEKIKEYCEWAGVKKLDDFFEQSAEYTLSKDKAWLTYLNQKETV